jgi:hypothetical protein
MATFRAAAGSWRLARMGARRPAAETAVMLGGLMIVGRLIGWFLLFCALVLLGWDAVSSLSAGDWGFAVLGQRWFEIDQALGSATLNTLQAGIERNVSVDLWDNVFAPLLLWPAVAVFVLPGLVLVLLFRRWGGPRAPRKFAGKR